MKTNLCTSLSLLALSLNAYAADSASTLTLPSATITATAENNDEADRVDLNTPTGAGSRLGLSALETPASTDSLTGKQIRARGDVSVQDAVSRSAGINRTGSPGDGGTSLSARGFACQGSVMQLYDGSRMYEGMGTVTFPVDTWSVDRVDVLRGPASVLYGEGATGAVVNVIPKKPFDGDIQNHIRIGAGSYGSEQTALDSGGSLTDQLSYSLNVNHLSSNGWIDRGYSDDTFVSGALRWKASDNLTFTLAHDYGDQNPQNYFGTPLINGHLQGSLSDKNYNVHNDKLHYNDQWTRLTSEWQISDSVSSTNELYYFKAQRRWQNAENYNWDADTQQLLRASYISIKHDQEQVGDRQSFTFNHQLFGLNSRTVLGADYNRIHFKLASNSPFNDVSPDGEPIDLNHPQQVSFHSASPFQDQFKTTTQQFSVFGENRTELTDQLSLVTGLRRDYVSLDRVDLIPDQRSGKTLTGNNWKIGLVYALTPDASVYGQYSTSTDGVGGLISLNQNAQNYGLSTARQSEVGFKQAFLDQRGEWTIAAYHIVKKKLLTPDPLNPTEQIQVGQQSSNGLEASLDLQLPHDWALQANASIVRAQFDTFSQVDANGQTESLDGKLPVDVPRRTANLWLSKGITQDVRAGTGVRYVDARFGDFANENKIPGYTVVDANVSWKALSNTTLWLQLTNLFNREYALSEYNNGTQWILGQPRSFFVTADVDF